MYKLRKFFCIMTLLAPLFFAIEHEFDQVSPIRLVFIVSLVAGYATLMFLSTDLEEHNMRCVTHCKNCKYFCKASKIGLDHVCAAPGTKGMFHPEPYDFCSHGEEIRQ